MTDRERADDAEQANQSRLRSATRPPTSVASDHCRWQQQRQQEQEVIGAGRNVLDAKSDRRAKAPPGTSASTHHFELTTRILQKADQLWLIADQPPKVVAACDYHQVVVSHLVCDRIGLKDESPRRRPFRRGEVERRDEVFVACKCLQMT